MDTQAIPVTRPPRGIQAYGLLGWLLVSFAAAAVGGLASANARGFYEQLLRPEWAPPGALFAPTWTLLYLLMGVAAWLVWRERGHALAPRALKLFLAQLALNALWTWLFFVWRLGAAAFAEILLLWGFIAATMLAFARVRVLAAWLLLPYLAWVSFAAALTWSVWQRNPALLS